MKKAIILTSLLLGNVLLANSYGKDLQVFTSNTAGIACQTPKKVIYKGNRSGYAKALKAEMENLGRAGFAMVDGLGVGVLTYFVGGLISAATDDHEYLYVVECGSGSRKTRLMTLVVSNNKKSDSEMEAIAKKGNR